MLLTLGSRKLKYKKTGHGSIPIILLHGGLGLTCESLSIIHDLLPPEQFTVYSYYQSGCANNENAPFYKSVKAYADELNEIIKQLKILRPFVLGHSWGGIILQEFLVHYPDALRGAILSNTFSSGYLLRSFLQNRAEELPEAFHQKRKAAIALGDGDALDAALGEYWFPKFICRVNPLPQEILLDLGPMRNSAISYYFVGADLLDLNGALLNWDRTAALKKIAVPVLVMSGEFDYGSRKDFDSMLKAIPNAKGWYEAGVSHFSMYDNPETYKKGILDFLCEF